MFSTKKSNKEIPRYGPLDGKKLGGGESTLEFPVTGQKSLIRDNILQGQSIPVLEDVTRKRFR